LGDDYSLSYTRGEMKVAIITCYDQSDYVRARTLRSAFAACDGVEVLIIKNKHKGLARYFEVSYKILQARLTQHIDAYVVTFRGYEMFLLLRLTFARKPIIFDELINFVEYYEEHHILKPGTFLDNAMRRFYHWQVKRARFILTDTEPHAEFSSELSHISSSKLRVLPIAADEQYFFPKTTKKQQPFNVFYYGNGMTPLHGLQYVLDAAVLLKDNPNITFTLVGGHDRAKQACEDAAAQGAHVMYEAWVPFEEIPNRAHQAGLCLGGPFGDTLQSQYVVTGKAAQFLACAEPVLIGKNKLGHLFKDKVNALVVPLADSQAIAKAISWAAEHPRELKKIGLAGRKVYEEHLSEQVVQGQVNSMVQELQA